MQCDDNIMALLTIEKDMGCGAGPVDKNCIPLCISEAAREFLILADEESNGPITRLMFQSYSPKVELSDENFCEGFVNLWENFQMVAGSNIVPND